MLANIIKLFAGSHYKKFYKKTRPIIAKINALEEQYQKLTDEQLRAKTDEFKQRYANGESLDSLLPEAFATVKNAARRLCGKKVEVCGHEIEWQMVHYDVQLIGGIALHKNMIAEMATGEGKTLVATLPLYLNALTGKGCHLVTVNEYLAKRDSEWMGYLYNFLGISVSWIYNMQDMEEKARAYKADITYGTASEFGFDYLRDNGMASSKEAQVQRPHYFCIVDEVDSILIDEARTPLIISGPIQEDHEPPFNELKPAIEGVVKLQVALCNKLINEVRAAAEKGGEIDEATIIKMWQVKMGAPKNRILRQLMENGDLRKKLDKIDMEMASDLRKVRPLQVQGRAVLHNRRKAAYERPHRTRPKRRRAAEPRRVRPARPPHDFREHRLRQIARPAEASGTENEGRRRLHQAFRIHTLHQPVAPRVLDLRKGHRIRRARRQGAHRRPQHGAHNVRPPLERGSAPSGGG